MYTITQLEYVVAVDREKHFGKAAQSCHVSQPSLSAQIQKLEEDLEVIIFDRSKKPILPTEIGLEIISQAKLILKEHRKLGHIASAGNKEPRGRFHLGIIPTLAPYLLPLFVGHFSKTYPKVRLKINEYKTDDIIKKLINDEIDAGLLVTPLGDDRLIERHLFFENFFVYASENHPLSKKKTIVETQLKAEQLWLLEEGHCFRNQVLKVCSLDKKNAVLSNVEFESGNLETLKNLVKKNDGYTLLPYLAAREINSIDTKKYLRKFRKPIPTREVSLVYSRSFLKETVIEALETSILEKLPREVQSLKRADVSVINI